MSLTSDEVNFLVYRYLLEAGKLAARYSQRVELSNITCSRFLARSCMRWLMLMRAPAPSCLQASRMLLMCLAAKAA